VDLSEQLLPHMRRVQVAERDLCDLGVVWQMIESSAAISCPDEVATLLPTLAATRERFDGMRARLIERMVEENRAAIGDDLGARAQCAIDILVRNLYERTADVGFLATDGPVCSFCAASDEERAAGAAAMRARLAEYQAKYTVYDDIVLLSADGRVLARLDETPLERSSDPLLESALKAGAFVEAYGSTDLAPAGTRALRYAHRIVDSHGSTLGVLVLRFRFDDEMQRIFAGVSDEGGQTAVVLIDDDNRVVATNDDAHVPLGARMPRIAAGDVVLTSFCGREYLAVCRASHGYQGYAGPRWRAFAMVSLLTAFSTRRSDELQAGVPLDHGELAALQADADAINRELRRVIWNGRLMAGEGDRTSGGGHRRLKAVLQQVSAAGVRTRRRLDDAILELSGTSLARSGAQVQRLAALAADIMDRNLYERANDCRWWALSPVLRRHLAQPGDDTAMSAVLDHINGLYTVYSRLVVFDADGRIRAASRSAAGDGIAGSEAPAAWLEAVKRLRGSQHYAVSPFETTDLHDAGATYVYLAAVHAEGDDSRLAGGIAIVFNAARELQAMLCDILGTRDGFAAFVDDGGRVLAAAGSDVGAALAARTGDAPALLEGDGAHWACAGAGAAGYREFKTSDGYDNRVRAVVGLRIGTAERRSLRFSDFELTPAGAGARDASFEAAVFQVGGGRYAMATETIIEAVPQTRLVRMPSGREGVAGMLPVDGRAVPVLCARRIFGVQRPARATDGVVVLLRGAGGCFGLRVDDVLSVIEVPATALHDAPAGVAQFAPWVSGLVDCRGASGSDEESVLLQLVDPRRIGERLHAAALAA
jgi:chemotaxis signal transduction protein